MLNVNQITSQLAKLPDQALQQYAMMHKNDPYVLSLALAESNRRKEIRAGAQMNAPQTPKVADQAIQGMAAPMPETVGIGQLPAGNMDFAEGGIVAFDQGGEVLRMAEGGVPRYQTGGVMGPQMSFQNYLQQLGISTQEFLASDPQTQNNIRESFNSTIGSGSTSSTGGAGSAGPAQTTRAPSMVERGISAVNRGLGAMGEYAGKGLGALSKAALPYAIGEGLFFTPKTDIGKIKAGESLRHLEGLSPAPASRSPSAEELALITGGGVAVPTAAGAGAVPTAGAGQTTSTAPPGGPQIKPPTSPTGQGFDGSIAGLQKLYGSLTQGPLVDPFATEREELGQARLQGAAKRVEDFDADIAKLGELGAKAEERLKKRGERIEANEKQNLGLALLQAGSAMMAGKSKYALSNIGAGIGVGAEQFAKGLDKIDAAKERLDDAFDRLEQSRRSEQMLTASERRRLQGDVYNAFVESKKDTISGLSEALGLKHKQAAAVFDGGIKLRIAQMDQEGRIGYAERAGNLGLFRALGDGDVKKGFDIYMSSQTESKGLAGLVQNFAKNPTALALLKQTDPELANLIQMQMRGMALQPTSSPTGPVRP